jgi:hypothetical protein
MNGRKQFVTAVAAVVLSIVLFGCGDNDAVARRKLDVILKSDLAAIVSDIPKTGLADSIYYSVVSYQTYKTGDYTKKAVVDFYFMRGLKVKITRKYRFVKEAGMWERYYNVYNFIEGATQKVTADDSAVVSVPVQKK